MLRALGVLLLLAYASPSVVAQTIAPTWVEFRPEGVGFSVEMPGEWTLKTQDIKTADGAVKTHTAAVSIGQKHYWTLYQDSVRSSFGSTVTVNVKGGKLRKTDRLVVSNLPAVQIILDAPNGQVVVCRYFVVGAMLVAAAVSGPHDIETEADTQRFLGSLRVVSR